MSEKLTPLAPLIRGGLEASLAAPLVRGGLESLAPSLDKGRAGEGFASGPAFLPYNKNLTARQL